MAVITLSRQYGAGGLEIGAALSERLGYDFVDSSLLREVARRLEVPEEVIQNWDERRENLVLRLFRTLQAAHPEMAAPVPLPPDATAPDPDRMVAVIREVVEEESRGDRAVIVGRGAAFILGPRPGAHHFRLVAPRALRIERIAERLGLTSEAAGRRVDQCDRDRIAWLKHHFGVDPADPTHYTLVLNTGRMSTSDAVGAILRASGLDR